MWEKNNGIINNKKNQLVLLNLRPEFFEAWNALMKNSIFHQK